jgi:hypothetical protein
MSQVLTSKEMAALLEGLQEVEDRPGSRRPGLPGGSCQAVGCSRQAVKRPVAIIYLNG